MSKFLSEFVALDGFDGIYIASRDQLRCTAIRLSTGGVCLFSPVEGLGDEALASLTDLGKVEILIAPNHYHNKGLKEYAKAFPKALICASESAGIRLKNVTGLQFKDIDKLRSRLLSNMKLLQPAGLKTGEVWISIRGIKSHSWLVVDSFCGSIENSKTKIAKPDILKTFPKFGVADRVVYLEWLKRQIEKDSPTTIIPCHGGVINSQKLTSTIWRLVNAKL
ncbi:hypothetical protein P3G55_07195 [Leptospira sp. 96542]|nr:hypothetical protein [Leptospira sp. 96542]